jgi:hypothetical protein
MFQHLVQSCPQFGVNFDISVLHLDFEIAVLEAVLSIKLVIKLWTVLQCPISKQMNVRLTHKLEVCLC